MQELEHKHLNGMENLWMISGLLRRPKNGSCFQNAPSPAATASLSIGKTISEMVIKRFNEEVK